MKIAARVLMRAPLLPWRQRSHNLEKNWLLEALRVGGAERFPAATRRNFERRARARATPFGLYAGVAEASLGAATRLATGTPRAVLAPTWARMRALGRALLDDAGWRSSSRLKLAPSVLVWGGEVRWLCFDEAMMAAEASLAPFLDAVEWTVWGEVAPEASDDDRLELIDEGLLISDLEPPLVGEAPLAWMRQRLAGSSEAGALAGLAAILDGDGTPSEREARGRFMFDALPGAALDDKPLSPMLVHQPREAVISRAAVERAASLAGALAALQQALAPPLAERALDAALLDELSAAAEQFGAGAFDIAALAGGGYGIALDDERPRAHAADVDVVAWLAGALAAVERDGGVELALDSASLPVTPVAADSFELMLTPAREPRRAADGTDWLLGLHAPAGATVGRFADALGPGLIDALVDIEAGAERLDVAYAPSAALADVCRHPAARRRCLTLHGWSQSESLSPFQLRLGVDPSRAAPLSLDDGAVTVTPSPLQRVRSTTAPSGLWQLLGGWSLWRQHAPWAFSWGPLAGAERLPRVTLDGFVIAPRSWRLPPPDANLRRWRQTLDVPAQIFVGTGDELALIDLDTPDGRAAIRAQHDVTARAWEIWPPPSRLPDKHGRRVELVAMVVDDAAPAGITAASPPPADRAPSTWAYYKLFTTPARIDALLAGAIAPLVANRRYYFQRYIDAPGRAHLRLRLDPTIVVDDAFAAARAAGDLVTVERCEHFSEPQFAAAIAAVESAFQADSHLVLALLDDTQPLAHRLVAVFDAHASALPLPERRQFAATLRATYAAELATLDDKSLAAEYRSASRNLQATLSDPPAPYRALKIPETAIPHLAALIHRAAVRHGALDRTVELRAIYLWDRTLDGLAARSRPM